MKKSVVLATMAACGVLLATAGEAGERAVTAPTGNTTAWFGTGFAAGDSEKGAALRVGADHLLTGRLRLELVASYLDRGLDRDAWNGQAGLRLDLADGGDRAVPYFALGAGFYRARFHAARTATGNGGDTLCNAGVTACSGAPPFDGMPEFYRRRIGAPAYGARWPAHRTFTDPVVAVGFGVHWHASARLFVVPDVRTLLVMGDGDTFAVGVFTLNVGYRF